MINIFSICYLIYWKNKIIFISILFIVNGSEQAYPNFCGIIPSSGFIPNEDAINMEEENIKLRK